MLLGAATTVLGLSGVINPPTGGYTIFLRTIVGVIVLGIYHGLIILPVALVLVDKLTPAASFCQQKSVLTLVPQSTPRNNLAIIETSAEVGTISVYKKNSDHD